MSFRKHDAISIWAKTLQYRNLMRSFEPSSYWVSIESTECREGMENASLIELKSLVQNPPSFIHFIFADVSGLLPRGLGHKGKILLRYFNSPSSFGLFRALNQSATAIQLPRSVRTCVPPQTTRPLA